MRLKTALFRRFLSTSAAPWFWASAIPYSPNFGVHVQRDFLTEEEHTALTAECSAALGRLDYEAGHWDGVITNYKEVQRDVSSLSPVSRAAVHRAQAAFPARARGRGPPQPHFHALELSATGFISAHVDSVKFSGGVVCGLCLLSDAVMVLTPDPAPPAAAAAATAVAPEVRILLPRRCLYTLTEDARYAWAHAVPTGAAATYRGAAVARGRRISVMLRDEVSAAS
jgi:alkylated DNA repair protein alkB family protein 7